MKRSIQLLSFGILLVVLVGCSEGSDTDVSDDSEVPSIVDFSETTAKLDYETHTIILPIDDYAPTMSDILRLDQAKMILIESCMAEAGLDYPLARIGWESVSSPSNRTFGLWDVEQASTFGYSLPPGDGKPSDTNQALGSTNDTEGSWAEAETACYEKVNPQLQDYYSFTNMDDTVTTIRNNAIYFAESSVDGMAAIKATQDCQQERGSTFLDGEMFAEIPEDGEAAIRTAVVEAECNNQTGYIQVIADLNAKYQAALIANYEGALVESKKKVSEMREEAQRIIETQSPISS